jgi:uncharacterized protein (TIGR00369 family)
MVTLGYGPVEIDNGRVVFAGRLDGRAYNPLGIVHGGYAATLLDTVTGCAVHSTLPAGQGYTKIELKVGYLRPLTVAAGEVRATGKVVSAGRRTALATGELFDREGRLCTYASSTCMLMEW